MDVDLRKLRYFVAVAQTEHFGRAAQSLFVTQPVLSRQIQSLERALGCFLLERSTRRVQLTDAGRQLLADAPALLASFDAALHRVRAADRGIGRLAFAFAPGLRVSIAVRAFAKKYPDVVIDLFQVNWWDQSTPLRDGRADIGYLRRPFDDEGLHVVPISSEPLAAVLPNDHRLARRRKLRTTDVDGERILNSDNRNECITEEKAEWIIAGDCIALLPLTAAKLVERPGLTSIPVVDADPFETCLAVLEHRRSQDLHRAFFKIGQDVLTGKP
ncbi:LysR family transcriptional regulator [Mycobacterium aquaticum]|uniref:Probable hydrogen peroxide-inducible genes activator n=1 Tax=Mycobacterium aquaticum TaxID=1927124 RepID=A0A1X0B049_9MYCO|nr:LysR substrate-binding domain-containing protein [Mycobacterium aquaticum]ORA35660.1 LysR family transcriptional regulator [Mycobacterium aquaticum]